MDKSRLKARRKGFRSQSSTSLPSNPNGSIPLKTFFLVSLCRLGAYILLSFSPLRSSSTSPCRRACPFLYTLCPTALLFPSPCFVGPFLSNLVSKQRGEQFFPRPSVFLSDAPFPCADTPLRASPPPLLSITRHHDAHGTEILQRSSVHYSHPQRSLRPSFVRSAAGISEYASPHPLRRTDGTWDRRIGEHRRARRRSRARREGGRTLVTQQEGLGRDEGALEALFVLGPVVGQEERVDFARRSRRTFFHRRVAFSPTPFDLHVPPSRLPRPSADDSPRRLSALPSSSRPVPLRPPSPVASPTSRVCFNRPPHPSARHQDQSLQLDSVDFVLVVRVDVGLHGRMGLEFGSHQSLDDFLPR